MIGGHFHEKDAPTLNVELLRKIQAHITQHPEELDMGKWIHGTYYGTTGCIAGHACILGGDVPESSLAVPDVAQKLLGLNDQQRCALFYTNWWPTSITSRVWDQPTGTAQYAEAVSEYIESFISMYAPAVRQ